MSFDWDVGLQRYLPLPMYSNSLLPSPSQKHPHPLLKMSKKKKLKSVTVSTRSKTKKLKSVSANLECGQCGNHDFLCTKGTLTSDLSCARCGAEFGFVSIQFFDCLGWTVKCSEEKN